MIQATLLLGCGLSNYLYFVERAVASVVVGFISFGLLFYLVITSAATLSYNCPNASPSTPHRRRNGRDQVLVALMAWAGSAHSRGATPMIILSCL
jgi:hypothetical protein